MNKVNEVDRYNQIVSKLGFDPREYNPEYPDHECDNIVSSFAILNTEELQFLLTFLNKQERS